ncbi:aminotransferase class I/II-fold pyridoxal phosphate-dependent enzyme [Amycolatopsis sp. CA-128772]|uniref:aminotransferase class I/II-fold pyridoxal phosphate-dependent enzyme n=1 Tax=Amycolatopsis sp. CA-128772 TaxID=2073159 RepID=UPI000CD22773|nr:aminotransferase class I/II-fold pyridoxal phosphate-dependent enzyme [Amycolatopsis sp. CA-128772]
MVAKRAAALAGRVPAIAAAHLRAEADPYHPVTNPGGFLNLGTAENRLVWDLLAGRVTAPRRLTPADVRYGPLHGTRKLREATAAQLSRLLLTAVDADELVVVSGASAALDIAASVLCDPGDAVVVPAPYYGALEVLLTARSGARLLPAPMRAADGFRLDPAVVAETVTAARRRGETVRALVLTSPDNPTGRVHPAGVLRELLAVAARLDLDVVADEIYAGSVFGATPFTSVLDGGPRVHVVWGFAKDFGLPGLKVGALCSSDPEVLAAARALAYFAPVSSDTQALLAGLLTDGDWVRGYLDGSRARLAAAYAGVTAALAEAGVPYVPAGAGFSVWLDLRAWLAEPGTPGEHELWRRILDAARVNILPGSAFGAPEPGWFRLCFATDAALVREAVRRLGALPRVPR